MEHFLLILANVIAGSWFFHSFLSNFWTCMVKLIHRVNEHIWVLAGQKRIYRRPYGVHRYIRQHEDKLMDIKFLFYYIILFICLFSTGKNTALFFYLLYRCSCFSSKIILSIYLIYVSYSSLVAKNKEPFWSYDDFLEGTGGLRAFIHCFFSQPHSVWCLPVQSKLKVL